MNFLARFGGLEKNRTGSSRVSGWDFRLILLILIVAVGFLVAGGARDDILSLLFWRPFTVLAFVLAMAWAGVKAWTRGKPLLAFVSAVTALIVVHLVPLPPVLWSQLPGRDLLVDLYSDLDIPLPWLPISVAPVRTWNALFSLAAPVAALLLALSIDETERQTLLLRLIIVFGLGSGLLGLLQAIGPVHGPLYFYRITNYGDGVGLFSNRNHQAALMAMLFPLLAAYLSIWSGPTNRLLFQRVAVVATALFLVPLLLVTGSRAGLLLGVVGLGLAWWVYTPTTVVGRRAAPSASQKALQIGGGLAIVAGTATLAILAARASSLDRLLGSGGADEVRLQALPIILDAISRFFPVGSGIGSFVEVFRLFEPYEMLGPLYLNHAHNDVLEVVLTAGLPGVALMAWAVVMGVRVAFVLARVRPAEVDRPARATIVLGRTGIALLILLALASIADYPLRVPSLAVLAAVSSVWALNGIRAARSARSRDEEARRHRYR